MIARISTDAAITIVRFMVALVQVNQTRSTAYRKIFPGSQMAKAGGHTDQTTALKPFGHRGVRQAILFHGTETDGFETARHASRGEIAVHRVITVIGK